MIASIELLSKISDYLDGRITLWDLERWLVPRLPAYFQNLDSSDAQLVGIVELCLAELQAGIRTEAEIRHLLSQRIPSQSVVWTQYPASSSKSEAATTTPVGNAMSWGCLDPSQSWNSEFQEVSV